MKLQNICPVVFSNTDILPCPIHTMSGLIYNIYQATNGIDYPEVWFFLTPEACKYLNEMLCDEQYEYKLNPKHETFSCNATVHKHTIMRVPVYFMESSSNEGKIIVL